MSPRRFIGCFTREFASNIGKLRAERIDGSADAVFKIVVFLGHVAEETATAAVNNMVGSITGIICDGAKVGCSIKLVCAVDSAFQAAMMAMRGLRLPTTNGVLGDTLESSLANIGLIAAPGMIETDDQILSIMLGKPLHAN